jgi:hypothetical protein
MSKPVKVTPMGNLYKINLNHLDANGNSVKNMEVWTTKEAVQKHFETGSGQPHDYELKKFARINYEKQMRTHNGSLPHGGMLITTDSVTHGNPKLWPSTLSHPEIKM